MADEDVLVSSPQKIQLVDPEEVSKKNRLSASVQAVVDRFAKEAVYAHDLLHLFKEDKTKVYLYSDGTYSTPSNFNPAKKVVAETKLDILEYAFPDPENPSKVPPTLNGFSFQDLLGLLYQLEEYFKQPTSRQ